MECRYKILYENIKYTLYFIDIFLYFTTLYIINVHLMIILSSYTAKVRKVICSCVVCKFKKAVFNTLYLLSPRLCFLIIIIIIIIIIIHVIIIIIIINFM